MSYESSAAAWRAARMLPVAVTATALAGTLGSLILSVGLGLKACPLCFYQRSFMMAVLAIYAIGLWLAPGVPASSLALLCLAPASAGLGVAAVHTYLVTAGILVCPAGLFGLGSSPAQSLAVFILLNLLLVAAALLPPKGEKIPGPLLIAPFFAGALIAGLCIWSAPPMPPFNPTYDAAGKRILLTCEPAGPAE